MTKQYLERAKIKATLSTQRVWWPVRKIAAAAMFFKEAVAETYSRFAPTKDDPEVFVNLQGGGVCLCGVEPLSVIVRFLRTNVQSAPFRLHQSNRREIYDKIVEYDSEAVMWLSKP